MLNECFDPLVLIDEICSGGFKSAKLKAYMSMRDMVVRQIGEAAAPIMNEMILRNGLLRWFQQEIAKGYRVNRIHLSLQSLACLLYARQITSDTSATELARLVHEHPGTDWGITDLDALAELFSLAAGKRIAVIGNLLSFGDTIVRNAPETIDGWAIEIRKAGGHVTDELIEKACTV